MKYIYSLSNSSGIVPGFWLVCSSVASENIVCFKAGMSLFKKGGKINKSGNVGVLACQTITDDVVAEKPQLKAYIHPAAWGLIPPEN